VISFEKDMLFSAADCKQEQQMISGSTLISIPSLWGHFTMLGVNPEDFKLIDNTLKIVLEQSA